jgi:hypothetical protein
MPWQKSRTYLINDTLWSTDVKLCMNPLTASANWMAHLCQLQPSDISVLIRTSSNVSASATFSRPPVAVQIQHAALAHNAADRSIATLFCGYAPFLINGDTKHCHCDT